MLGCLQVPSGLISLQDVVQVKRRRALPSRTMKLWHLSLTGASAAVAAGVGSCLSRLNGCQRERAKALLARWNRDSTLIDELAEAAAAEAVAAEAALTEFSFAADDRFRKPCVP